MTSKKHGYEAFYRRTAPTLRSASEAFDFETLFKRLESIFRRARVNLVGEDFSISFGMHIHEEKRGQAVLYYPTASGFNMPRSIMNKIANSGTFLRDAVISKLHAADCPVPPEIEFLEEIGRAPNTEDKLRNILRSNSYNQLVNLGKYPAFLQKKLEVYTERFSIEFDIEELRNIEVRWVYEYFVVTVLEACFMAPHYLSYSPLCRKFGTVMLSMPVHLAHAAPMGDIFVALTYNKEKPEIKDVIVPRVLECPEFKDFIKNELASLCRIAHLYHIIGQHAHTSAVAAVMVRNLSHNFGAHVLASLSEDIEAHPDEYSPEKLADLLRYMQQRHNFIANTTGGERSIWGRLTLGDIRRNFERQEYVLDYLRMSGNAEAETCVIDSEGDDIYIALPYGDTVGQHIVFSILENYIRNCLKHQILPDGETTLRVFLKGELKTEEGKVIIELSSNAIVPPSKLQDAVDRIKAALGINKDIERNRDAQLCHLDGSLNPKSWGIKEMRVCASLLGGRCIGDIKDAMSLDEEDLKHGVISYAFKCLFSRPILDARECGIQSLVEGGPPADILVIDRQGYEGAKRGFSKLPNRVVSADNLVAQNPIDKWFLKRVVLLPDALQGTEVVADQVFNSLFIEWTKRFLKDTWARVVNQYGFAHSKEWFSEQSGKVKIGYTTGGLSPFSQRFQGLLKEQNFMLKDLVESDAGGNLKLLAELVMILGCRVLIVDNRIWRMWGDLPNYQELHKLGIDIKDENSNLKPVNLRDYHFLVVHRAFITANEELLCDSKGVAGLPPFLFFVTGAGTKPSDFPAWFSKSLGLPDLQNCMSPRSPTGIDLKTKLVLTLMSA